MGGSDRESFEVAVFCGPQLGHFGSLAPIVRGLMSLGQRVTVYAPAALGPVVGQLGGQFVDLYRDFPIASVDNGSIPFPCRSVSHAGHYAWPLISRFESAPPDLIIYETFAVVGRLVGVAEHSDDVVSIASTHIDEQTEIREVTIGQNGAGPVLLVGQHRPVQRLVELWILFAVFPDRHPTRSKAVSPVRRLCSSWLQSGMYCAFREFVAHHQEERNHQGQRSSGPVVVGGVNIVGRICRV